MMLHHNAATAAARRASGQATNADFHRSVAVVIIAMLRQDLDATGWSVCCGGGLVPAAAGVLQVLRGHHGGDRIHCRRAGKGQGRRSDSAAAQHNHALASYYGFQCSARFIPATSG
jgi:hypothetical protein